MSLEMQVIKRRVIINEKDFPKLKRRALIKSDYGHTNLYDTCEWRPITNHEILLSMIKHNHGPQSTDTWMFKNRNNFYDKEYDNWIFLLCVDNTVKGYRGRSKIYTFGWATLTKELP